MQHKASSKTTVKVSEPSATGHRTTYWWGVAGIVTILLLLSLLPGGSGLRVLILPVLSLAVSVWAIRRFKSIRALVICLIVLALLLLAVAYSLSNGSSVFGY